jgi:DNA gyrase/topoisomerase IV subunit A
MSADLKRRFGDPRRSVIEADEDGEFSEDLIPEHDVLMMITERAMPSGCRRTSTALSTAAGGRDRHADSR